MDTDIRLAVTRNLRELFEKHPWLKTDASTHGVYALLKQLPEAVDPRCFLAPVMELVMYGTASTNALRLLDDSIRRGVAEMAGDADRIVWNGREKVPWSSRSAWKKWQIIIESREFRC